MQVLRAIPRGMRPADSVAYAQRYIEQWKRRRALAEYADEKVEGLEDKVAPRLEAYRRQLYISALEEDVLREQFTTDVTEQELAAFYKENRIKYIAPTHLYRFAYVKTKHVNSPQLRNRIPNMSKEDREIIRRWCRNYAPTFYLGESYENDNVLRAIEREVGYPYSAVPPGSPLIYIERIRGQEVYLHFFYMYESIQPGEAIPLKSVREEVKTDLLAKRKREILAANEQRIMETARAKGWFE